MAWQGCNGGTGDGTARRGFNGERQWLRDGRRVPTRAELTAFASMVMMARAQACTALQGVEMTGGRENGAKWR